MPEGKPYGRRFADAAVLLWTALLIGSIGVVPVDATEIHTALKNGQFDRARAIIEDGFKTDSRGPQGDTALHWVAFHGHAELTQLLLSKGAKVNAKVRNGNTPLHLSAYAGEEQTMLLLLDAGANVNARNNDAVTPLHWAARNGHVRILQILLSRGANLGALDAQGRSALDYAASREQDGAFELLRNRSGTALKAGTEFGNHTARKTIRASGSLSRKLDTSSPSEIPATFSEPEPAALDRSAPTTTPFTQSRRSTRLPPASLPSPTTEAAPATDAKVNAKAGSSAEPHIDKPQSWVQLAALSTKSGAISTADRISKTQSTLLGNQSITTHRGSLKNGLTIFRVRIGPLPRSEARRLCAELKKNRQSCFVAKATN